MAQQRQGLENRDLSATEFDNDQDMDSHDQAHTSDPNPSVRPPPFYTSSIPQRPSFYGPRSYIYDPLSDTRDQGAFPIDPSRRTSQIIVGQQSFRHPVPPPARYQGYISPYPLGGGLATAPFPTVGQRGVYGGSSNGQFQHPGSNLLASGSVPTIPRLSSLNLPAINHPPQQPATSSQFPTTGQPFGWQSTGTQPSITSGPRQPASQGNHNFQLNSVFEAQTYLEMARWRPMSGSVGVPSNQTEYMHYVEMVYRALTDFSSVIDHESEAAQLWRLTRGRIWSDMDYEAISHLVVSMARGIHEQGARGFHLSHPTMVPSPADSTMTFPQRMGVIANLLRHFKGVAEGFMRQFRIEEVICIPRQTWDTELRHVNEWSAMAEQDRQRLTTFPTQNHSLPSTLQFTRNIRPDTSMGVNPRLQPLQGGDDSVASLPSQQLGTRLAPATSLSQGQPPPGSSMNMPPPRYPASALNMPRRSSASDQMDTSGGRGAPPQPHFGSSEEGLRDPGWPQLDGTSDRSGRRVDGDTGTTRRPGSI